MSSYDFGVPSSINELVDRIVKAGNIMSDKASDRQVAGTHYIYEHDPGGKAASDPGSKLDAGKLRAGLMYEGFARALTEVARVTTFGAHKYTPRGWESVPGGVERYTDAMHRHLLAEQVGEADDSQSGLLHAAHAAWNALARLELILRAKK